MKKGKREIFQTNKLSFQIPSMEKIIGYTRRLSHTYIFLYFCGYHLMPAQVSLESLLQTFDIDIQLLSKNTL